MNTLLLFGDSGSTMSRALIAAALRAAPRVESVRVVAICDAARAAPPPWLVSAARHVAGTALKRAFDPSRPLSFRTGAFEDVRRSARSAGVPLVVPPERDINHPAFVRRLRDDLRPSLALALGCLQIFRPPLLETFDAAANFHNALLPRYRGLRATRWAVYHGEETIGFSFHRMDDSIDTGRILVQGALPLPAGTAPAAAEDATTRLAARSLEDVLRRLATRDPGHPQRGQPSYHGRRELRAIRRIDAPDRLTWAELRRRLHAFDTLELNLAGSVHQVTRLELVARAPAAPSPLRFRTLDGIEVAATRLRYLPPLLYRPLRRLGILSGAAAH